MSALAATAPSLHDGLPGILGLAAVVLMVAIPTWLRARRAARRTLSRHRAQDSDGQSPVVVYAERTPE